MLKVPFVPPFSEVNLEPSLAKFENPDTGVRSAMQSASPTPPTYNGMSLDDLRAFQELNHHDRLDCLGIATKQLAEQIGVYKKSGFASAFAKSLQIAKK